MGSVYSTTAMAVEEAGWQMAVHVHESYELSVVLEGRGSFDSGGRSYSLEPGHAVLIPPDVPHSYRADSAMRFAVLEAGCPGSEFQRLFGAAAPSRAASLQFLPPIAAEQYEGLFRSWLRIVSRPLVEEQRCLSAWAEVLLLFILQHRSEDGLPTTVSASADHIRSSLRSELSVAELARQCSLSESAYRAMFRRIFGMSPKQYQQACRLEESRWMLRSTARPIHHIAEQVGFSGIHPFSAWFQKVEGSSPSDWRKRQQGGYRPVQGVDRQAGSADFE